MKFFTSDTHWGHNNIIPYCKRPFSSVEEMDETLITNWNAVVRKSDEVYHLGDFAFRQSREEMDRLLSRLNGNIHLIQGNHDRSSLKNVKRFASFQQIKCVKIGDQQVVLCHYPMRSWPSSHRGSWHLYGHCHGTVPSYGMSFDVGVDSWSFMPVREDAVEAKMEDLK
jgi:calcineurin-like phosphoesterase family protein